ncbi:unnamed protein product, partial [Phaeothamnion confervicola]
GSVGDSYSVQGEMPPPRAIATATYACRILANVACDEDQRERVAEEAAEAVVRCLRCAPDDPMLVQAGCLALYNLVHMNEAAHAAVVAAGAREATALLLRMVPLDEPHLP